MTALDRVRAARSALAGITVVQSVLWATVAALAASATLSFFDGHAESTRVVAACTWVVVAVAMLWRGRAVWSAEQTALWIEERAPQLQYALVTAIEPAAIHYSDELARVATGVDIRGLVLRAGARAVLRSGAAVVAGLALLVVVPPGGVSRVTARGTPEAAPPAANRLLGLVVRVTPPEYARQMPREMRDPVVVTALVGSAIDLSGRGSAGGLRATTGEDSVVVHPVTGAGDGPRWTLRVTMPAHAGVIRMRDRGYERVLELDAIPDSLPVIVLDQPSRDSTLRSARGILRLGARARDDIGLRDGYFELIISAGNQEGSYHSVERRIGTTDFANAPRASLASAIDLASLGLAPGGRLSVRAVVRDDNAVGGSGSGTSETRTFRIAAPGEYDSLAVEPGAPPPVDSAEITQRMIVVRTRALRRDAPQLPRDTVARRAETLSLQEERLSERVQSLLNGQDEDEGGGPLVLPDWQRPLFDTALRALGDASAQLHAVRLAAALVPELLALRVLDSARTGNRLYLRGGAPVVVVNTARVRLTGHDKPDAGPRKPEPPADTAARAAVARLESIAAGAVAAPEAAADSIALFRVDIRATWPSAAAALGDAAAALRARKDPGASFARARRAITGAPSVAQGLSAWDGGSQ
ncbi:MAG: hypothetical protein ACHQTF_09755 [Gemmatimonadales bacterium]